MVTLNQKIHIKSNKTMKTQHFLRLAQAVGPSTPKIQQNFMGASKNAPFACGLHYFA